MKIGFLGLGVMGLPMAKNVVKKCGCPVLGYDVAEARLAEFKDFGGEVTSDPDDIYRTCDVVMQILPTHPIIIHSVERAIELGKPGNIIIDLSSTAPDIVLDLHKKALDAGDVIRTTIAVLSSIADGSACTIIVLFSTALSLHLGIFGDRDVAAAAIIAAADAGSP